MSKNIFRNFDRLIPQAVFNKPNNNYVLGFKNLTVSPSSYYYNRQLNQLPQGQPYDVFQLSNLAYDLVRERVHINQILKQIEEYDYQVNAQMIQFREILNRLSLENATSGNSYLSEIQSQIKAQTQQLTASDCANFIYVSAQLNRANPDFFKNYIYPTLLEKFQYLSLQNCYDLVNSLVEIKLHDKLLLEKLLDKIQKSLQDSEYHYTQASYTKVDSFDRDNSSRNQKSLYEETYYSLKLGKALAFTRFQLLHNWGPLFNNYYNRLFFRDNRIQRTFAQHNQKQEFDKFVESLKTLHSQLPELKANQLVDDLLKRKAQ